VDRASALLAAHLPADLAERAADLGAGDGFLAAQLVARCPGITALDLYEAEQRALEVARRNVDAALRAAARMLPVGIHWHDVTRGLPERYDVIVSNPPFHVGRAETPALGQAFITRAADALVADGRLLLVANRQLPYEAVLAARFAQVGQLELADGFKVIEARGVRP
jgi:16S rRNA (guanine1207-N2)-methyltransferase